MASKMSLTNHSHDVLTNHVWIRLAPVIFLIQKGIATGPHSQVDIELDYDGGWHSWAGKPRPLTTLSSASRRQGLTRNRGTRVSVLRHGDDL